MGLRFRKSIKIAPGLKINLNKNSVSATIGTKGAHYTVNSKGKKTVSAGIPGTGISYVKTVGGAKQTPPIYNTPQHYSGSPSNNASPNNHGDTAWYKRTGWIVFWLVFFFPLGLFLMWKYSNWKKSVKGIVTAFFLIFGIGSAAFSPDLESISLELDDSKTYYVNQSIPIQTSVSPDNYTIPESAYKSSGGEVDLSDDGLIFTASKAGTYKIWADHQGIKSDKLTVNVKNKKRADKRDSKKNKSNDLPSAVPINTDLLTTPLFTAKENHPKRVDQIAITAKENASTLTDDQATQIVNEIKSLNHQYFTDNTLMEQLMWHGYLLYYHYDDGNVRKDLGENLTQCVKKVYQDADAINDYTETNFIQIDESLQKLDQEQAQLEAQKQAELQAQQEAQKQAELQAQQEAQAAEAARIAAEQEAALQAQQQQQSQAGMVWISATGSKYHSTNSCGQMNPATSYQMSLSDAQAQGYEPCKRCH